MIGQLEAIRNYYQDVLSLYDYILDNSPPGGIICQHSNGREQFIHAYTENGKRVRKGINRNPEMQRILAQKAFAERAANVLRNNLEILDRAIGEIIPFDPDQIMKSTGRVYESLPEEYYFDRSTTVGLLTLPEQMKIRIERHREWGGQSFIASDYKPEEKKHKTSRGLKMRSKSEVLIMERLYHYGIDVRYEMALAFGREKIAPDFTFEAADGSLFFLEHMGMMDEPGYARRNYAKLNKYFSLDIVFGKNLILSFDRYGIIDLTTVDFIINNEIIPRL